MYLMHHFFIFVTALFMSVIMVPPIRRWALDAGAVDRPGGRKSHSGEIPRLGGIAIYLPFLFAVLVYFDPSKEVRGILAGSLIIFFTGLADDLSPLSPFRKLVGQVSGCVVAVTVGHLYIRQLGDLFGAGPIVLPLWFSIPFTVFALVGVINAFNLIDGLDGLAGGVGVISLGAFFLLGLLELNFSVLALSAGLLGGMLGFLKYNAFPARIFMGDAGSLVVGFVLGSVAILLTQTSGAHTPPVVSLLILALPITDTIIVMGQRIINGQNPLSADRTHLHHKILELGIDHGVAVLFIYAVTLSWIFVALLLKDIPDYYLFVIFFIGTIVLNLFVRFLFINRQNVIVEFEKINERISSFWLNKSFLILEKNIDSGILAFVSMFCLMFFFGTKNLTNNIFLISFISSSFFLGICLLTKCKNQTFVLFSLIISGALVVWYVENDLGFDKIFGMSANSISNCIFVVIAFFLSFKFVFFKTFDELLRNPLIFIILSMSILLAVVSPDFDLQYHISGVLSKSIVLFLSFKVIIDSGINKSLAISAFIFVIFILSLLSGLVVA